MLPQFCRSACGAGTSGSRGDTVAARCSLRVGSAQTARELALWPPRPVSGQSNSQTCLSQRTPDPRPIHPRPRSPTKRCVNAPCHRAIERRTIAANPMWSAAGRPRAPCTARRGASTTSFLAPAAPAPWLAPTSKPGQDPPRGAARLRPALHCTLTGNATTEQLYERKIFIHG